jgi:hypothetical protein
MVNDGQEMSLISGEEDGILMVMMMTAVRVNWVYRV